LDYFLTLCYRETERDWDKDLGEDVKGECEQQYGKVERIKVEKESQVCFRRQY
jgi:hypothetical protein